MSIIHTVQMWSELWLVQSNIEDMLKSRYGLLKLLQMFAVIYLVVMATIVALSVPANASISANTTRDALASIILLGSLCLHLVSATQRETYSNADMMLDATILAVASLTIQSSILANTTYYVTIIFATSIFASQRLTTAIPVFLVSNLCATLGQHYLWSAAPSSASDPIQLQSWQFFGINIVGIPFMAVLIHGLNNVVRLREEEIAAVNQTRQQLAASRNHLVTAEKMAALGRLSGTIAHEINNQLTAIVSSLDLIQSQVGHIRTTATGESVTIPTDSLDLIDRWATIGRKSAQHSVDFLRNMSSQTRQFGKSHEEYFSLRRAMDDLSQLLGPACMKDGCDLRIEVNDADLSLYGDPGKFSQVMINLVNNAAEAYQDVEDRQECPIWVTVSRHGASIVIDVSDVACGIPLENQEKIFDYLFTTKPVGKGTGLGLSIVHDIVTKQFGGHIDVISHVGRGTSIIMTFPEKKIDISRELAII